MPELVNSRVGSLAGTNGAEGTTAWPRAAKNSRKSLRISEVVFIGGGAWNRQGREGLQPEATRLSVADRAPHAVALETAAVEEVGRLAPPCRGVHAAVEAAGHQVAGAPFPVVLAGLGQRREGLRDHTLADAVAPQLSTDPGRPVAAGRARARHAAGKALVVLPAGVGHARHRLGGVGLLHPPGHQLAGELGTRMLPPH